MKINFILALFFLFAFTGLFAKEMSTEVASFLQNSETMENKLNIAVADDDGDDDEDNEDDEDDEDDDEDDEYDEDDEDDEDDDE